MHTVIFDTVLTARVSFLALIITPQQHSKRALAGWVWLNSDVAPCTWLNAPVIISASYTGALRPARDEDSRSEGLVAARSRQSEAGKLKSRYSPLLKTRQNRLTGSKSMRITAVIQRGRSSHPHPQVVWCYMFCRGKPRGELHLKDVFQKFTIKKIRR